MAARTGVRHVSKRDTSGYSVTPEIITRLSPYKTEHMNRFGHYDLRFDHVPQSMRKEIKLSPAFSTSEFRKDLKEI